MSTSLLAEPLKPTEEIHYPDSDDKPMAETAAHFLLLLYLVARLRNHFRGQQVYVIGNMFLYWKEGKPKKRRAPDIMVVKGVDPTISRRTFKIWEEKAVPSFILEATSASTLDIDLDVKHDLYEDLGVHEYFLFDPLDEELPGQLCGFRLKNGEYEALKQDADGGIFSEELGLRLVPHGEELLLIDPKTGENIPDPEQEHELMRRLILDHQIVVEEIVKAKQEAAEAQWKVQEAWQEAEKAKHDRDAFAAEADVAKRDSEILAGEVERLKKLLEQHQGSADSGAPKTP